MTIDNTFLDPREHGELGLFANAVIWKKYYAKMLSPHIHGNVAEIGAGLGATTAFLQDAVIGQDRSFRSWLCVEPDERNCREIEKHIHEDKRQNTAVQCGTLQDLGKKDFDTIIYIDVLEHIADDRAELALAAKMLTLGGKLVVLVPAHQYLRSPFDEIVGHHRRYSNRTLRAVAPSELKAVFVRYLDSVGILTSLMNRWILKQEMPTDKQIKFWDRKIVPVSKIIDPLTGFTLGKSVVGVWERL